MQQQKGRDVVLVVQNGRAERRAVTVSSSLNDEVVLSAGIAAGERVIIDPPPGLVAGSTVKLVSP